MMVSSPGKVWRKRRCASISAVSSPGWVEAAAMTDAVADRGLQLRSLSGSAGGAGTSSLRLPVVEMRGAPRSR